MLRFGVVGLAGFATDATALLFMIEVLHTGPFFGRAFSVAIAIVVTFVLNRHWSFATAERRGILTTFFSYLSAQGVGLLCNLTIYSGALVVRPYPIAALVLASGSAMVVNYLSARYLVFRT